MTSNDDNADSAPTSAGAGATDETTNIPAAAEATPDLAWSLDGGGDAAERSGGRHSWGSVWARTAVVLGLAGGVAVVIGIGGFILAPAQTGRVSNFAHPPAVAPAPPPSTSTVTVQVAPSTPPATVALVPAPPNANAPGGLITLGPPPTPGTQTIPPPPAVPGLDTHDQAFLAALGRDQVNVHDASMMVLAAHRICGQLAAGVSHDDVGWELRRDGSTGHDAFFVIYDSAVFYCPHYQ